MNKFVIIALLMLESFVSSTAFADGAISNIVVQGNQRVEKSTIKEYLGMQVGDNFSADARSNAVKSLYGTSLFENIDLSYNGGVLTVTVKETPFISKVEFKGNYKVKSSMLSAEMATNAGESLSKAKLSGDIEKIKEIYKRSGRFSVRVDAKVQPQENNRVKIIFNIEEGPKTGVKAIYFSGNQNYSDSELKSILMTKESRWFRFLETNDTYDPDRIEYDKHLLTQFYNSVGFADFRIISVTADLLPTKEGFVLTYSIEEGNKYKFGKIDVLNRLSSIDEKEVHKFVHNKKGDTFNLRALQKVAENISNHLSSLGYPQVEVYPDVKPDRINNIVDATIIIDQADKIFINKINIEGNLKTEDHVIRRQLKIAEGDVFNRAKIDRGEQNIRNLDYFDKLFIKVEPTSKRDRYDINIDVEEKSTSSIGFDVGYNTAGGPFGRISFLERNLVGTGKYLNAGVQGGRKSTSYYLGLTDPNFLDRDLTLSGTVFRNQNGRGSGFAQGEQNYSLTSVGAKTSIGYDVTEDLSHEVEYSIKRDILKAPDVGSSIFIREQMGTIISSAIGHSLTYDKLDSKVLPKSGYVVSATQEFAGVGGNNKYIKHELDGKYFKSFVDNKYTVKLSASCGHIKGAQGKTVRISDRFNVGDYTLRGFAFGGIGPRDKVTKEGLGGQKYYTTSAELSFPLGLPEEFNLSGSLFIDAGSLWDADSKAITSAGLHNSKSLRSSVGFGFLWVTKIAPIRMDWGFPIKKEKYDETQSFHIKFSTHF